MDATRPAQLSVLMERMATMYLCSQTVHGVEGVVGPLLLNRKAGHSEAVVL